jgi:hypothetical protein
MRPTVHHQTRRVIAAFTVAAVVALGACGSDGESSGSGDSAEFCARLGELAAGDDGDTTTDDLTADLQQLADIAPDDVADDMQAFVDLFLEMDALSEDQSDELSALMDEFGDLTSRLDTWSNEFCPDLPENVFTEG